MLFEDLGGWEEGLTITVNWESSYMQMCGKKCRREKQVKNPVAWPDLSFAWAVGKASGPEVQVKGSESSEQEWG
jgi:hypothetical protein